MANSIAKKGQGSILKVGGNVVAELKKIARTGGKANFADTTNMDSPGGYEEMLPTTLVAGEIDITGNFLGNADASQLALQTLFDAQTLNACEVVVAGGRGSFKFNAYVSEPPSFDLEFSKEQTF